MKKSYSVSFVSSAMVVFCYGVLTLIAFVRFPSSYSPIANWLSDLGNAVVNPDGAAFYNLGITISGILLFVFFLSLSGISMENNQIQRIMTILTIGFGCAGSLAMIMSAVFPINYPAQHGFWCMNLFFSIGTAFAFSVAALRYHRSYPRALLGFGIVTAFVNLLVQMFFHDVPVSEWINVPLLLGYCLCLGISTYRMKASLNTRLSN